MTNTYRSLRITIETKATPCKRSRRSLRTGPVQRSAQGSKENNVMIRLWLYV